jgi:hypothetical protein
VANESTFCDSAFLRCESCDAFYHVIKMRGGAESEHCDVNCRNCGFIFPGRDGAYVLKYILLRQIVGPQKRRRAYQRRTGIPEPAKDHREPTPSKHVSYPSDQPLGER